VKKRLQQRHLRRLGTGLIARQAGRKPQRRRNQKTLRPKNQKGKKEEKLARGKSKEKSP
jgi:hypothetical protein